MWTCILIINIMIYIWQTLSPLKSRMFAPLLVNVDHPSWGSLANHHCRCTKRPTFPVPSARSTMCKNVSYTSVRCVTLYIRWGTNTVTCTCVLALHIDNMTIESGSIYIIPLCCFLQELGSLGLPPLWTESGSSSEINVVAVLNCIHDLIQLHHKGLRCLESMELEQHRSSSNVDHLQLTNTRLKVQW